MTNLDDTDRRLLASLQKNANLTTQELSEVLHLSASQIGRRKHRLEAEGYITAIQARLDPRKVGLTVQAFIQVQMAEHTAEGHRSFLRLTEVQPQITATWTLTGDSDFLLRVFCTDLADLNRVVQDILLPHPAVARVQSQIVMEQIKRDAPLPV